MPDVGEILKIAAIVLFVVVPVLARLFRRPEQAAPPARPVRDFDEPVRDFDEDEGEEEEEEEEVVLNAEIERFLREAAGQRSGPPVAVPAPVPEPPVPEPIVAEIVKPRRLSDSGSRHFETSVHADEQRFRQHTSLLGEEVGQADEEMEGHIHATFGQRLGSLTDTSVGADVSEEDTYDAFAEEASPSAGETPPSLAAELAATFSEPQSIRQAIILSEIFTRPEHRWS